jgi:hypothetical protein
MSESFSRVLYPFEISRRPSLEPEVRRAILARWSSNHGRTSNGTAPHKPTEPAIGQSSQSVSDCT